jgi:hypothetical protein
MTRQEAKVIVELFDALCDALPYVKTYFGNRLKVSEAERDAILEEFAETLKDHRSLIVDAEELLYPPGGN